MHFELKQMLTTDTPCLKGGDLNVINLNLQIV